MWGLNNDCVTNLYIARIKWSSFSYSIPLNYNPDNNDDDAYDYDDDLW